MAGRLDLSTPIAKLLNGLCTINKGKGIGGTIYAEVKDDFSHFVSDDVLRRGPHQRRNYRSIGKWNQPYRSS
jgi:hypothetical protein